MLGCSDASAPGSILISDRLDRRLDAVYHFILHYHLERNHQGLGNRLIVPIGAVGEKMGSVQRRERLGGMLSYYYRDAA